VKVCLSCGDENSERARFCQSCATPLTGASEPLRQIRKVVTIVFADVTGSTALGERLDPEALRRLMGRYFDEMEVVIGRHGGTVEKFIGDAVMAVFGIPRLHEDDALRAVRAAEEMRAALAPLNVDFARDHGVELRIRIGVNTGEVVAGDATGDQRLVTGDAVNVAARLEQAATPGDVLLGETTYRLVKDAVEVEAPALLDVRGKADGVRAYRLTSVRYDELGHKRRLDSPLVGRETELQLLDRALERAVSERTSHLFTLLGPAGVGKSRLVQQFLASIGSSATTLRGRCLSYGEGITFFPLAEVIQQASNIRESDAPSAARGKLTALVADAPDSQRIAPLVAGLIGWSQPGAIEDAFWAVRKLFEHLARKRPLVVVFDDIHWGEQTFLDLIDHLADWTRDAAVLLLCVARPELLDLRPVWAGGKLSATSILLERLTGEDASRLLDNLLGSADIPARARHRILEASEGNPLFVEEMVAMLIERDMVASGTDPPRSGDLVDISVPPTIQLLLAARLDALEAEDRAVIERGAVEGNVFHAGAVATLAPEQLRSEVPARLLALTRKELIRPDRTEFVGQDAFRFRHLLIRDAAYQALSKEVRAELHERFARWLELAAGDRIVEYEEILAYHLEQAYRSRSELGRSGAETDSLRAAAAERLLRSAERANDKGDLSSGRALIERAVDLSEARLRGRALLELALTLSVLLDFRRSTAVAREAMDAAEEAGDRACWLRARLVYVADVGQIDPAFTVQWSLSEARAMLQELESLGDEAGTLEAKLTVARHLFYLGEAEPCRKIAVALLSQASDLPFQQRRAIVTNLVIPSYFGPTRPDEALAVAEESHRLLSASLVSEADLAALRTALFGMMGWAEESRAEGRRANELWDEVSSPGLRVTTYQFLGEAERFLGRSDLAEQHFRQGVEGLTASGETGFNSTMTALLALSLCDQERFDEAEGYVSRSRELGAEDDFATQMGWRMALARVHSYRAEHAPAIALADEAVAMGESTDYIAWQAEAHDVRGRVLLAAGRRKEARDAFAASLDRFERKGVVPAVDRLRARLENL
jgi:class 3 adenylate cyclase/predicted negative regulator of RcsB-dependent stress response